jgi:hypothetical protein
VAQGVVQVLTPIAPKKKKKKKIDYNIGNFQYRSSLKNKFAGHRGTCPRRLRQEECLSPRVQEQHGQYSNTPSQK